MHVIKPLEEIPFNQEGMGKRVVINMDALLIMQIALLSGQKVPEHEANSDVCLNVIKGSIVFKSESEELVIKEGELLQVEFGTKMNISNQSKDSASFLVLKTPHPAYYKQG